MNSKLSETIRVYEKLKEKILKGQFLPGEKLTEQYISDMLGTSRYTVKLALVKLGDEGLVTQKPNRGFTVSRISIEETIELLKARALVEGLIGRIAVDKITDKELSSAEVIISRMTNAIKSEEYDLYSRLNTEFHNLIYESTQNKGLIDVALHLKTLMIRYQYKIAYIPGRANKSLEEHTQILNALKMRDSELCGKMMFEHVNSVMHTIQMNFRLLVM